MASLGSILGAKIALTTDTGDSFEGDLFAYDEKSHTVVLATQDQHDQQHATLRMIRETAIKDLQYVGVGTTTVLPKGPLPAINEKELHAREKHTMKLAQRQASNTNARVPVPVQTLFDRISGSHDMEWSGVDMLIFGNVKVSPPYTAASVSGLQGASTAAVQRIAKIVQGWRQKEGLGAAIDAALASEA